METPLFWTKIFFLVIGLLALLFGAVETARPAQMHRAYTALPRNRMLALLFTGIAVVWCALIVWNAELGRFSFLKPFVWPGAIFTYWAVVRFLDELLAARALGGLLVLAAQPILMATRWAETRWHLLLVALVYYWIILGAILILNPWFYRLAMEKILPTPRALCAHGILALVLGAASLAIAFSLPRT